MPLEISRNDIRNIKVDAIVNPSDRFLSGTGGTDRIIHEMAGDELYKVLDNVVLNKGEAIITDSYNCNNCKYIIHTSGPMYEDGNHDEEEILASCYRNCLNLAKENNIESIAFPLIASGSFMFPKGKALKIATDTITEFLLDNEMNVYLLVYDNEAFDSANKLYRNIKDYLNKKLNNIDQSSIRPNKVGKEIKDKIGSAFGSYLKDFVQADYSYDESIEEVTEKKTVRKSKKETGKFEPDESFSECLIRMIDEKGLLDPEVYKKANIDRKHFNHIINTKNYRPKKETAVALAIGMKLNIKETNTLLERAGFILSRSSKFDLIIKYCIENKIYDIYAINEILFEEDQKTLGC